MPLNWLRSYANIFDTRKECRLWLTNHSTSPARSSAQAGESKRFRKMKRITIIIMLFISIAGCKQLEIVADEPCEEIENDIRQYYVDKYTTFAQLNGLSPKQIYSIENTHKVEGLIKATPVSAFNNSFPYGPYFTFMERTELPNERVSVRRIDLHINDDRTCRIVLSVDEQKNDNRYPFAVGAPISEEEIRDLIK